MNKKDSDGINAEKEKFKPALEDKDAEQLYEQVKYKAHELYEDSKQTVCDAQDHIKDGIDCVISYAKEKPLTSLLIAGGIGFLLASISRKK